MVILTQRDWWDYFIRRAFPTGRRHCTKCGRWRPVTDFHVARLHHSGRPLSLRSVCMACNRNIQRERRGLRPNYDGYGRKGSGQFGFVSASERIRLQQQVTSRVRKQNLERYARHRAYNTEWARVHARLKGIPPRRFLDGRNAEEVRIYYSLPKKLWPDPPGGIATRARTARKIRRGTLLISTPTHDPS
jgi:hypothetical protein